MSLRQATKEEVQVLQKAGHTITPLSTAAKPKKDTLTKVTNTFNTLFPGKQVGNSIGTLAGYALSKNKSTYDLSAPTPLQVGGDVAKGAVSIAGLRAPVPAGALGRIGQSAAIGGAAGLTGGIAAGESARTVLKDTAIGTATGAVVQSLFEAVPAVSRIVGKKAKDLRVKNLKLSPTQRTQLNGKIDDITTYLKENNVTGNPAKQYATVSDKYQEMEGVVNTALKQSGKKYTKQELISMVQDLPDTYAQQFDNPEVYNQLVNKSDNLIGYIQKNFGDEIPVEKVNSFKRSYYKNAFNKAGDAVNNEANLAIGDALYEGLLQDVPNLREINKEYQTVILARKILGKALGKNQLGLIGSIVAGGAGASVGASIGGPIGAGVGAAVGPAVGRVVAGTAAKTNAAIALEKIQGITALSKESTVAIPRALLQSLFNNQDETNDSASTGTSAGIPETGSGEAGGGLRKETDFDFMGDDETKYTPTPVGEKIKTTNYDPYAPSQTRKNTDGKGAAGIVMDKNMVATSVLDDGETGKFRLGTVLYIPALDDVYLVADTLNDRHKDQIDFATPKNGSGVVPELNTSMDDIVILRQGSGKGEDTRNYVENGGWNYMKKNFRSLLNQ